MKQLLAIAGVALLLINGCGKHPKPVPTAPPPPSPSVKAKWDTDLNAALARAKEQNKLVFADFTGSDWCRPCMALHDKVLTSDAFVEYAKNNLVLVEIDYPIRKSQPAELKRANEALKGKYKITGWPTIIVLNADGKVLHREGGYDDSSATEYVAALKKKLER